MDDNIVEINYKSLDDGEFLKAVGMDGKKWTEAFLQLHPEGSADHGLLLGWFCNAIMAGYDAATHKQSKELQQLRAERAGLLEWVEGEIWADPINDYQIAQNKAIRRIISKLTDASSSNGRTPDFESENCGSIPQEAAKLTDSAQSIKEGE